MDEIILETIKKMIGPNIDYGYFDTDLLIHINAAVSELSHIGIGPENGLLVNNTTTWSQIIGTNSMYESVKQFVYLKCKLIFDPPESSSIIELYKQTIAEIVWRLNSLADNKKYLEELNSNV